MAKGESKSVNTRVPKPKTALQKAKASENARVAAESLARRQDADRSAVAARRAEEDAKVLERSRQEREDKFVEEALSGSAGIILRHWLKHRQARFELVQRFFSTRQHLLPQTAEKISA